MNTSDMYPVAAEVVSVNWFEISVALLGGLALFIFGLQMMASNLQKNAGKRAHRIIEKLTSVPVVGVAVGAVVTVIVQSSTLVSVMLVGLANASLINFRQAAAVIFGANIGTTLSAQLIAFRVTDYWPYFAFIGFVVFFFFKKRGVKNTGQIVFAIGMLLLGLALMSDAMRPLRTDPGFQNLVYTLSSNRILAFAAGFMLTALIQSSTASTGIVVTMAMQGLIGLDAALPIVLGINAGSCVTTLFASIGGSVNARRTAIADAMFNIGGALTFLIFTPQFEALILFISPNQYEAVYQYVPEQGYQALYEYIPGLGYQAVYQITNIGRQVANVHTMLAVLSTAIFLILFRPFTKLLTIIVPDKGQGKQGDIRFLDNNMVNNPVVAINLAQQELLRMAELALDNVRLAYDGFIQRDEKILAKLLEQEKLVNALEIKISDYLTKVSQTSMPSALSALHTSLLHAINDVERISDHADNIGELAQEAIDNDTILTMEAIEELGRMHRLVVEMIEVMLQSIRDGDPDQAQLIGEMEDSIDKLEQDLRSAHINRLKEGLCSPECGVIFLDMLSNYERIGDHAHNLTSITAR